MEIQQMIEEHNKRQEEYQKVLNELNRKLQKQCHKDLIIMFSLFMFQFPFSVAGAFGYIRFMPLLLLSSVICAFNVGMAYQRYLDAKRRNTPNR